MPALQGKGLTNSLPFALNINLLSIYVGFFKNARRFMFWNPVLIDNSVNIVNDSQIPVNDTERKELISRSLVLQLTQLQPQLNSWYCTPSMAPNTIHPNVTPHQSATLERGSSSATAFCHGCRIQSEYGRFFGFVGQPVPGNLQSCKRSQKWNLTHLALP